MAKKQRQQQTVTKALVTIIILVKIKALIAIMPSHQKIILIIIPAHLALEVHAALARAASNIYLYY